MEVRTLLRHWTKPLTRNPVYSIRLIFTAASRKTNAQAKLQCDGENRHVLDSLDVAGDFGWSTRCEMDTVDAVFLHGEIVVVKCCI